MLTHASLHQVAMLKDIILLGPPWDRLELDAIHPLTVLIVHELWYFCLIHCPANSLAT